MLFRSPVVVLLALTLGACASVPAPVTRSRLNPAHPDAPEGAAVPMPPPLVSAAGGKAGASAPAADDGGHSPPSGEHEGPAPDGGMPRPASDASRVYACPIHPEVREDEPGACPVCGMARVPKKTEPHP